MRAAYRRTKTNMRFDKRIVTHTSGAKNEHAFSNGFVISNGSYSHSIHFFNELAAAAKKDFPFLSDHEIDCFVISKSSYNNHFAGVKFPLPANTKKSGYANCNSIDFSIC